MEIAQLSLWIRTARPGQPLTDLSAHIRCGNSVVDDPTIDPKAFDWKAQFPSVFERGGFDAVVGNPPYVRQELLSPIKPYLQGHYQTYHGMADLYVYFYERGVEILKLGGRLAFVVTNKWMKAGYGEPLRKFFGGKTWVEQVVDFGHAKQFFKDADVFPSFLIVRRPVEGSYPQDARVCVIPRDMVRIDHLKAQVLDEGNQVSPDRFDEKPWSLEGSPIQDLMAKIRDRGEPLGVYVGSKPLFGIKTGFNKGFLITDNIKDKLIAADPSSKELIRPYLRGQDLKRWHPNFAGFWMILLKSSANHDWPWSGAGEDAEGIFRFCYPSVYDHIKPYEEQLEGREDKGRFWWELRSCSYYDVFDKPKVLWQDLGYHSKFCLSSTTTIPEATCFSLATDDLWLLAVLNSPLMWVYLWRHTIHGKDEVLRLKTLYMEKLPIVNAGAKEDSVSRSAVSRLIQIASLLQSTSGDILDWLRVQHEIADPNTRLQDPIALDSDAFVAEAQKARGKKNPLTAAGLRSLRDEYSRTIEPARLLAAEALQLEYRLHDLVNAAYGLTTEEVRLMWDTAPPRMPITRPQHLSEGRGIETLMPLGP